MWIFDIITCETKLFNLYFPALLIPVKVFVLAAMLRFTVSFSDALLGYSHAGSIYSKASLYFTYANKTFRILRGFEQISSSICCCVMLTKICFDRANHTFLATLLFLPKIGFLSHTVRTRNAGNSINSSADSNYSLVSKQI